MRRHFALLNSALVLSCALVWAPGSPALTTESIWRAEGPVAGEHFGRAAASCDLNGDGAPDWIVGAPGSIISSSGTVYVYFGGAFADGVPDVTMTGVPVYDEMSLASAGDVNGDGYQDLVVGAEYDTAGGTTNAGRAYVYFGGPGVDGTPDWILTGTSAGGRFGYSVDGAGDVNGDGFDDVIVGAPVAVSAQGRAYLFLGAASPDPVADLTLSKSYDQFGATVSAAGDMNGDGYADFAVGAPYNDDTNHYGAFAVYFGAPNLALIDHLGVSGGVVDDRLGLAIAEAGDVNLDGYDDLLVTAYHDDANSQGTDKVYLYLGGSNDLVPDRTLTSPRNRDFGAVLAGAGDLDRDGFADFMIAEGYQDGVVWVYRGSSSPGVSPAFSVTGPEADGTFGTSVAASGDSNGDGFGEILVGAQTFVVLGPNAGNAQVFSIYPYRVVSPNGGEVWIAGSSATVSWRGHDPADVAVSFDAGVTWSTLASGVGGSPTNSLSIPVPPTETEHAMIRVSATGSLPLRSNSDTSDGRVRIILPKRAPSAAARVAWVAPGAAAGDRQGSAVASAGDVNGDGYADVVVGAPLNDAGGADAGRAYVYLGGPASDGTADLVLTGASGGDSFGWAVSSAGDWNRDGYADVIVGAPGNDALGADAGLAYVYFGGPMLDATADLLLNGGGAGAQFGYAVAPVGDVNGDGCDDVVIGAPYADVGQTDAGQALVFFGGVVPDAVSDLIVSGTAFSDQLGASVAAGDVNGDGHPDLLVGVPFRDHEAGIDAGAVRILHGGPALDAVADLVLTGEAASGYFGYSVAAQDTDGDGRANVLVGAPGMNVATGAAYLFCRSGETGASAACRYDGEESGDFFGYTVALANCNGDGYADPIVGAPYADAAGVDAGKAYVFYGAPGGDIVPDHLFVGSVASRFGYAVAGAGNVLGDGAGVDLLVGAPMSANGKTDLYDFGRYRISAPNGGETWQVGALKEVRWSGAEPANVWLSSNGGQSYELLRGGVGGKADNTLAFRVPHTPTKFARLRIAPVDAAVGGQDETDSLFTIQTSVTLLALLAAPAPGGAPGAVVSWSTDPGPADLAGYRLERGRGAAGADAAGGGWVTLIPLTRESSFSDRDAAPGSRYRLHAVNGLGEEILVGETSFAPRAPLAVWPLPYRGGKLTVSYAAGAGWGGAAAETEVSLFDVRGRLVRRIASGRLPAGYHAAMWDGLDDRGGKVAAGVYFLLARSAGEERTLKVAVLR